MKGKEEEILSIINTLLQEENTDKERSILNVTKLELEKNVYFPKVIASLESALTPLAVRQELSPGMAQLYLTITSHRFKNKGLGKGIAATGSMFSSH